MEPLSYSQQVDSIVHPEAAERRNKKRKNRRRAKLQKVARKINRRK